MDIISHNAGRLVEHYEKQTKLYSDAKQHAKIVYRCSSHVIDGQWSHENGSAAGSAVRLYDVTNNPLSSTDFRNRLRHSSSKVKESSNEPCPEDLAAMMHRHEAGLNMSSAPTTMLKFLFPLKDNSGMFFQETDLLCEISCFGPGPWIDNATFTSVEMRGTANPTNFPGFLVALPATDGKIALAPSPSPVLSTAYEALQTPNAPTLFIQ